MRKVFVRYFLSIFAIAVVVMIVQFGMLVLQYRVSQDQWKTKVYDDFILSVENSINDGSMADYGLNSIYYTVSNIEDDRISGFILRDISGSTMVAFGRNEDGRALNLPMASGKEKEEGKENARIKLATRIDVNSTYDPRTRDLSLTSVASVETKGVEISVPDNLRNEGIIGSLVIAIDGTDREHDPFVELVRNFSGIGAVLLFYGKTQFQKQVFLVPGCNCVFCEGVFLLLGISELELLDRFVCKAPLPEIG